MTSGGARPGEASPGPFDVLVLGSGVAGLSVAVRLAGHASARAAGGARGRPSVAVLTKGELSESATRWAQGGVAAVLGGDEDSTDLHLADTLAAGAGLCDEDAVRVLVDEGPDRVHELITLGAQFDREDSGDLSLAREGGHSRARVVHAGGAATGAEVERALVEATRHAADAVLERWFALELLVEGGRCAGVLAAPPEGPPVEVRAAHVVLATGGVGQLFAVTTNPSEATGDGVAMALRAGVPVADLEFVQFHPTALHHPAMPRPLLSEALRGHGALLRDAHGERFVDELAPRDVVSCAMAARMREQGVAHLWLDATGLDRFAQRFPTIAASLATIGLDPSTDWLPIAPAAHHLSGGVVTDLWGATALRGLWAAGEAACTGVHGANRLASNSLLEGMVFGARLAERISAGGTGATATGAMRAVMRAADPAPRELGPGSSPLPDAAIAGRTVARPAGDHGGPSSAAWAWEEDISVSDVAKLRARVQLAMTAGAGVVRSAASLAEAAGELADVAAEAVPGPAPARSAGAAGHGGGSASVELGELANLVTVGEAMLGSATLRHESRGAHVRAEYPAPDPAYRVRLVHGEPADRPARGSRSARGSR
ncbi:MAG TPA: FAD-binding protein [Acidimicrobiales bacterium]